jgi:phosphoribosyl-AMP cyclohydrolase
MSETQALPAELDGALALNAEGLIPAIAQQRGTGEVLMMAWMNREALAETLATGRVCYWSRSRGRLWRKGETSGHTGRRSCFYRTLEDGRLVERLPVERDPKALYGD